MKKIIKRLPSFRKCPRHEAAPLRFCEGFVRNLLIVFTVRFLLGSDALPGERLKYNQQIPHKAACEIDYKEVIVLAAFAE